MEQRKTVIIAATQMEIDVLDNINDSSCVYVVGGIGATNTAIATIRAIEHHKPQLIIQVGIAGAFDKKLAIGDVVFVTEDYQADLGAWRSNKGEFEPFSTPYFKIENTTNLKSAKARSVNTACLDYLPVNEAQVESMEGAAFFQAASKFSGVRSIQIRSVSNYVIDPRDKWNIPLALDSLRAAVCEILKSLR